MLFLLVGNSVAFTTSSHYHQYLVHTIYVPHPIPRTPYFIVDNNSAVPICGLPSMLQQYYCPFVVTRNHEIPGRATAGHLQAAGLSVCVICTGLPAPFRAVSTLYSVPTHAMNQTLLRCYDAALKSELVSYRIRTNAKLSLQQQTLDCFQTVPSLISMMIIFFSAIARKHREGSPMTPRSSIPGIS